MFKVNKSWHGGNLSCQAENIAGSSHLSYESLNVVGKSIDSFVWRLFTFTERSIKISEGDLWKV